MSAPRRPDPRTRLGLGLAVFAIALAGCSGIGAAAEPPTPAPNASCAGRDASGAGYYPALEARLPAAWDGRKADGVKSGRYCSPASLGTLAGKGIAELRFAGATWTTAANDASVSFVAYAARGLTVPLLADEFAAAGQATYGAGDLKLREATTIHGRSGIRLEMMVESVREVRLLWPSADGAAVDVVIASGATEAAIESAETAFSS